MTNELTTTDWYTELISECIAILSEAHFQVQSEILRGKWEIGRRITQDELHFNKAGYGDKVVEILSGELGISPQTLWKCVQFYKKFKELEFETILGKIQIEGKTPSWHRICQEVLPAHKEETLVPECEHTNLMCFKCRKRFSMRELKQNL